MTSKCDICGDQRIERIVDGKTVYGPWAWMCERCHRVMGVGLGTGKGQLYDVATGKKLEG